MAKESISKSPLNPPKGGAIVRMYRIGHGDCFLLSFAGKTKPCTILIDCGCKPGSPEFLGTTPEQVAKNIRAVTSNGMIDVLVITHEHQDHVNALGESLFKGFEFGQIWLAWTEKSNDPLAKKLKKKYAKKLAELAVAGARLSADAPVRNLVDEVLELETGALKFGKHRFKGETSVAKAMKFARENSKGKPVFMYPHEKIFGLPEAENVRVYPLGPPYNWDKITDLEPKDNEQFHHFGGPQDSLPDFSAALTGARSESPGSPFAPRYGSRTNNGETLDPWYLENYGNPSDEVIAPLESDFLMDNVSFRRIEDDWLNGAGDLALRIGNYTNNSSLVLAFELGKNGKVLLFAADAQRGNWASWADKPFTDDNGEKIETRDLLSRTVLYKVGHHGSHNATLYGEKDSEHPSLGWLGTDEYADEFTAMITAVRKWAMQDSVKWDHPLGKIKDALIEKSNNRVLQTDMNFEDLEPEPFEGRLTVTDLYFDLRIDP